MFASTKFALVIFSGMMWSHPSPDIDTTLRFNDLKACLAAKALLEVQAMPRLPREDVSSYVEFHCVGEVS